MDINEKKGLLTGAISLLADVCDAAGSPTGKQTPEELVARIRRMREALAEILAEEMTDHKSLEEFGGFMLPDELRNKIKEALK